MTAFGIIAAKGGTMHMDIRNIFCLAAILGAALDAAAADGGQWTAGMDDDAGIRLHPLRLPSP